MRETKEKKRDRESASLFLSLEGDWKLGNVFMKGTLSSISIDSKALRLFSPKFPIRVPIWHKVGKF